MKTRLFALSALVFGVFAFTSCETHNFHEEVVTDKDGKPELGPGGEPQKRPGVDTLFKAHGSEHDDADSDHEKKEDK